jgi:isoleucyl-tRNA synthetase
MDKPQAKKSTFAETEEKILDIWAREDTFKKSLSNREGSKRFNFYDGPPFANGMPHFGHSLVTSIKDSIGRYKTMQGYYVERRNGWDCHGLPVEFAIEKQFGVSGKKQILDLGLDKFNAACRESVFLYKNEWEQFFKRMGRWTDTDNSYATIDKSYTESVWWVLKQINEAGLLYKGFKSMPYCPRCETPLSNFEVNEGYRDDVLDPSLYVKFKLKNKDAYLLAWTTTPWSLPGNAAIAVDAQEAYVYVQYITDDGKPDIVILAKKRLEVLDEKDYTVIKEIKGQELVGKTYEPLFEISSIGSIKNGSNLYKIWDAETVSTEDGTGVLHVAPAFGEEDLSLSNKFNIPVLQTVDTSGHITKQVSYKDIQNVFFKKADKTIIEYLTKKGQVFAAETTEHTYPFCYRCESPLLYYAVSTWFINVSLVKDQLQKTASTVNWTPKHIKEGRFGKWLEGARDWAISRNRFWGAPLPVWINEKDESDYVVVGSIDELKELAGKDVDLEDLHRPFIDKVVIKKNGKTYKRAEEVLDCWFESGAMPIAQRHYPFNTKENFNKLFPADFVTEGLDQTHLWFYVLHVISSIIFDSPAYKNVLVNGIILAADGEKLSKRLKNYPPIQDVFSKEGADVLRLYLLSNYQSVNGDYMRFNRDAMKDLSQNVLGTLNNSLRFLKMYSSIDEWEPPKTLKQPVANHVLDTWMLARVNQTIKEVTEYADSYQLAHAIKPIFNLVDDMSNWYIRRSRRRFWKSKNDEDKLKAYEVLHFTLIRISQLLAPWAPFYSDYIWRELVAKDSKLPQSVHLTDWPKVEKYDEEIIKKMVATKEYVAEGLSQRAAAKIKVRQPLQKVTICTTTEINIELKEIIAEELNVKMVEVINKGNTVELDTTITENLKLEGLMRDIVRQIQATRKKAGLNVSDRINLKLETADKTLAKAIEKYKQTINDEVLAIGGNTKEAYTNSVKIDNCELSISLEKA